MSRAELFPFPAHDLLGFEAGDLVPFFAPRGIAVIGASDEPGSVGSTLMRNLLVHPFGGAVVPVNPAYENVMGVRASPRVSDVQGPLDLAVIATPAPTVPGIVEECVDADIKAAIIVSAGFRETGEEGARMEAEILEIARAGRMRIVGPNCLGVMHTRTGLNATFAAGMARKGRVGFLSQSGALCTAILDWSLREKVGFSAFVSVGSMLDVGWADMIRHLGNDPGTDSILIYMETVGDGAAFLSAARQVAPIKPIIVIKPGRTEGAARAAASHTGSMTGRDEVLATAFQRSGVLRVETIADLFNLSEVVAKQPNPPGRRLTILTNAGGPGVLTADALVLGGGELAELSEETVASLDAFLPDAWSKSNPIDILGDAGPDRYARAVEAASQNPDSDGLLVVLTPQAMTRPTETAEELVPFGRQSEKPVLASWMGGEDVEKGEALLNRAGIPTFPYPDMAARMFTYLSGYESQLDAVYETPGFDHRDGVDQPDRTAAEDLIASAREAGRTLLTEYEARQLLQAYRIPTTPIRLAEDEEEAVSAAEETGFPVVVKLHSQTITHKTDIGGVRLGLQDEEDVREAYRAIRTAVKEEGSPEDFEGVTVQPMVETGGYELILGSSIDQQFGPVILFGQGGALVEVYQDRALALPPLNEALARRLIMQTRIYQALKGVRGRSAVNLHQLSLILVRFSQLVSEMRLIRELDINPLLAGPENVLALDARAILVEKGADPGPPPAIRPYPSRFIRNWEMEDGTPVTIRPVRPHDAALFRRFHRGLSADGLQVLQPETTTRTEREDRFSGLCFVDYRTEIVFVAVRQDVRNGRRDLLAAARLHRRADTAARFTVLVAEDYRGFGLGSELLQEALRFSRESGWNVIRAYVAPENEVMQHILQAHGFELDDAQNDGRLRAVRDLEQTQMKKEKTYG